MYERYMKLRDEMKVTDAAVAKGTGLNPTVFADWKRGKSKPKADKLLLIARYFGVQIEYFVE